MRVLLVEDNAELSQLIAKGLASSGFEIDRTGSLAEAAHSLATSSYAAMILDLGLPDGDGRSLLRSMRARKDSTPVLILTARGSIPDRVAGLGGGADDYLVKPFAFEELVARLQALLRRPPEYLGKPLRVGNVSFDTVGRQAFVNDRPQSLSARELALLEILIRRAGRVVPKALAEGHLFGLSEAVRSNAIEVYVHRLRKQLAAANSNVEIHTVRGIGYLMTEAKH